MKDGIGEGSTRADHQEISNQNYDAYSRAQEVRALSRNCRKSRTYTS